VALDWAFAMLPVIIIVTTASYSLGEPPIHWVNAFPVWQGVDWAFAMLPVIIIVTIASYSLGKRLSGMAGSVYHWIGMVGIGIVIALCAYAAIRPA